MIQTPIKKRFHAVYFLILVIGCLCGGFYWMYVQLFTIDELLTATWNDDGKLATSLVLKGKSVNVSDDKGRTALMWAVSLGEHDLARLYLQNGAKVNDRDSHGRTALYWAENGRHGEIAALIRKAGGTR